jgi:hypothetical protein
MWVLILLYFSGGNPSIAMHDLSNQAACEHARVAAQEMQSDLPGIGRIRAICVSKV